MTLAQFLRYILNRRGGIVIPPPIPPPAVAENPSISGVAKVGELLAADSGTYTNGGLITARQWYRDGAAISGATSGSYLQVEEDLGALIGYRETATNISGAVVGIAASVGPVVAADIPVDPGDAFDGVDADTMLRRAAIVAEYDNAWPGYEDQPFEGGDYLISSVSEFNALFNLGGRLYAPDTSKWYRVQLNSAVADWAADMTLKGQVYSTSSGLPTVPDRDYVAGGGGILIESSDPENPVTITGLPVTPPPTSVAAAISFNGMRGVHMRHVQVAKIAGDQWARDRAFCVRIARTSSYPNLPVVRISDCGIGLMFHPTETNPLLAGTAITCSGVIQQVDVIDNRIWGYQSGLVGNGVRLFRRWGNDFQQGIGDASILTHTQRFSPISSPSYGFTDPGWDERAIIWFRKNTGRNLVESDHIAAEHSDFGQIGTSGDVGDTTALVEFEAVNGRRSIGADVRRITYAANPASGSTITVSGIVFTILDTPVGANDIQRGGTLAATLANIAPVINAAAPTGMIRCYVQGSTQIDTHWPMGELGVVTVSYGSLTSIRPSGATQGFYADDSKVTLAPPLECTHNIVMICNLFTGSAACAGMWNGDVVMDRCSNGVPSLRVPSATVEDGDGYNYSTDTDAYLTSGRFSVNATAHHVVRNSTLGKVTDLVLSGTRVADGAWSTTGFSLTLAGNRYGSWTEGGTADVLVNGPIVPDPQGRMSYVLQNDGLNSQEDFRAALYDVLKLADTTDRQTIGSTDPATWADA